MRIINRAFGGERPKIDPRNLSENEATLALDCELTSTGIRALRSNRFSDRVLLNAKTIYFYQDQWVGFEEVVDVIESPTNVTLGRLYWTGDEYPRQATLEQALAGKSTRLGIPTPAKPTLGGRFGVSDNIFSSNITTFYTASFVNSFGEEGDMSAPSDTTTYRIGHEVEVGNLGASNDNSASLTMFESVVAYRLYRFDPDSDTSRFIAELPISTT